MLKKIKDIMDRSEDEPLEFDGRYNQPTIDELHKHKPKHFKTWMKENSVVISRLKKKKHAPSLDYFYGLFTETRRFEELKAAKAKGIKIVGTFCNMVPEELIYAADAIPVRLCSGYQGSIGSGEEIFPRDSCPLIKSALGFTVASEHLAALCDAFIIPATCDGKKKLGEILNMYAPVWMLDLPQSKERSISRKYWLSEIRILVKRLEKLTGNKIHRKKLKNSILLLARRYMAIRELLKARKHSTILGSDFFIVMQAAFFDEINRWIENAKKLVEQLKQMKPVISEDGPRLLVTGAPIILPNFKIPDIIENNGAIIIMDETCAGSQYMYDPVEVDEDTMQDMLNAVAERYLMPSVCPCFIKAEDRMDKLLDMIKEYKVEGVVYHTLRLCLLFDVESLRIKNLMLSERIPFLHLNTDYSKEDIGQLTTRIEAFIEVLNSRK